MINGILDYRANQYLIKETLVPNAINQGGVTFYINEPFAPTAANVSVGGRVLTNDGRILRNAVVTITNQDGNFNQTRTSTFGYYRFEEIEAGQTYIVSVYSKGFQFSSQVVTVSDNISDLNFTADK